MSKVIAHEELMVDYAVVALTPSVYNPAVGPSASFAKIQAEDGPMRYCVDGQDPSPSFGDLLEDGDIVELPSIYHIKTFKVIRSGSLLGKITITYED
ncbi:MAG: hypothetical protein Q8O36_05425 [Candidatus Omnitrophota bacterium]|nr:hypothetical protein [Candidatus Omnitrophota bacterium]